MTPRADGSQPSMLMARPNQPVIDTSPQQGTGAPALTAETASADSPHKHQNWGILTVRDDKNEHDCALMLSGNFAVS